VADAVVLQQNQGVKQGVQGSKGFKKRKLYGRGWEILEFHCFGTKGYQAVTGQEVRRGSSNKKDDSGENLENFAWHCFPTDREIRMLKGGPTQSVRPSMQTDSDWVLVRKKATRTCQRLAKGNRLENVQRQGRNV